MTGKSEIACNCIRALGLLVVAGFLVAPAPVAAQSGGNLCIKEEIGGNPPCTANDVRIGTLRVTGGPALCVEGQEITVTLEATIESGPDRYAVGLWINQVGGSALSDPDGVCFRDYLHPVDQSANNDQCDQQGGPYFDADEDGCGDVYAQNTNPCGNAVTGPCTEDGGTCLFTTHVFEATILCNDADGDGQADVGGCTSWDNNEVGTCANELGTDPGTGSKCSCDDLINVGDLFTGCMTDTDCDDGVACTDDVCTIEGNRGTCSNTPNDGLCSGLSDQCNDGVCDPENDCQAVPVADSTPCEDGDSCTSETGTPQTPDHCEAGVCVGVSVDCSAEDDQCNVGVCDPSTGACVDDPRPDSTPCEDGDFCTSETGAPQTPDHCEAGVCVGVPVDCSAEDDQCNVGVCDPSAGACVDDPRPDSTPCEDGDFCTSETGAPQTPDHCEAGVCVGVPVDCSAEDDQCNVGTCDPSTGGCFPDPVADSTPCEDGIACTSETGTPQTPDHCSSGECVGVPVDCSALDDQCNDGVCNDASGACEADPKPRSTPCEDGDACTSETATPQTPDHCDGAGSCVGVPVDCSAEDDQCNVGTCDPSTGGCFPDPVADSTPCEDGDICTSETGTAQTPDHCSGGVCTGVPVDCSALDDQCNDGVCNDSTGACEADPKPLSTPCEDGDACTSETATPQTPDHCDGAGSCVGVPVDCSAEDDQCNVGTCDPSTGGCFPDPVADSTPCEDGDICTSETGTAQTPDHCSGGVCTGVPVDCSALDDQCNDGVCNDSTGACEADPKPESTPCEDGDACTSETGTEQTPDHCDGAGECVGVPVDCSALDDQCNDGACDPSDGACFADPKPESTPCEDGDHCTSETGAEQTPDHCDGAGSCVGVPVDCSEFDDDCNDGACDPADGACFADPKPLSTPCEDGNDCTSETGEPNTPDHCDGDGSCVGIPVPEGTRCGDDTLNECTEPDTCDGEGECQNNNTPCGSITNSSLCIFDFSTKGICSDGELCDSQDACIDGTCAIKGTNCSSDPSVCLDTCSDGSLCDPISTRQFKLVYTPDGKKWPAYKQNSGNPGQFFYNLIYDGPPTTLTISIPYPFVTQGATPVHVYDGAEVGNTEGDDCFVPPDESLGQFQTTWTIEDWIAGGTNASGVLCEPVCGPDGRGFCTFNVDLGLVDPSPSGQYYVNVHMEYGLEGVHLDANPCNDLAEADRYDRLDKQFLEPWGQASSGVPVGGVLLSGDAYVDDSEGDYQPVTTIGIADCRDHRFSHEDPFEGTLDDSIQNLNTYKRLNAIFGHGFDSSDGSAIPPTTVVLMKNETGELVEITATGEGGGFVLPYRHRGKQAWYTVFLLGDYDLFGQFELKSNSWAEIVFDVATGEVTVTYDVKPGNGHGRAK